MRLQTTGNMIIDFGDEWERPCPCCASNRLVLTRDFMRRLLRRSSRAAMAQVHSTCNSREGILNDRHEVSLAARLGVFRLGNGLPYWRL